METGDDGDGSDGDDGLLGSFSFICTWWHVVC